MNYSIICIVLLAVMLQQFHINDGHKVGERQWDHDHKGVNCNHPSHKHDHSGHDHSGHDHLAHKVPSNKKPASTRPIKPRSIFPSFSSTHPVPPRFQGSDGDHKNHQHDHDDHHYDHKDHQHNLDDQHHDQNNNGHKHGA